MDGEHRAKVTHRLRPTRFITTADSNSLDAPSTMANDPSSTVPFAAEVALASIPAYTWGATAGPDDSAVLPRAASTSPAAHTGCLVFSHSPHSAFNTQAAYVSPGDTIDDLCSVEGTGASGKAASRSRAVVVDRSVLDSMMHLPRNEAAQMLGLCSTTFKKVCRRAGLQTWPYRRPLLGTTLEGGASTPFPRGGFPQPSPIQHTPALLASSSDNAGGSFRSLDAPRSAPAALTTSAVAAALHALETPSAERSCHVVDAVMDYLDALSSGSGAVTFGELEAVVEAMDLNALDLNMDLNAPPETANETANP